MTTVAKTKAQAVLGLRLAGTSFDEIAEALRMPDATHAQRAMEQALAVEVTPDDRAYHRQLANLRYERLLRSLWDKALDPSDPEQLPAARAAREIVDRMVVLNGAAQPEEVIVRNPSADAIMAWLAKVAPIELPGVEEHDPFAADVEDAEVVEEADQDGRIG